MTAISWPEIYQLQDENKQLRMENEHLKARIKELENAGWADELEGGGE